MAQCKNGVQGAGYSQEITWHDVKTVCPGMMCCRNTDRNYIKGRKKKTPTEVEVFLIYSASCKSRLDIMIYHVVQ